jgi:DNA invertase Pin-like site-specific DNA recombinase
MLAVTLTPSDDVLPPFPRVTIAECIDRLSRHMSYHQAHDVAILKMCADQKKIFTPEDLPVASCSFFATTTRVIRSNLPFSKPDHILGLVNMVQLRSLDKGQRKRINDLQMEHGWDITRFEEYDEAGSRSEAA